MNIHILATSILMQITFLSTECWRVQIPEPQINEEDDGENHAPEIWTACRKNGGFHPSLNAVVAKPTNCPFGVNTTTELKKVTTTYYHTGTLVS